MASKEIKNTLIEIFKDALSDAYYMWESEFCCGCEEREERKEEDTNKFNEFVELLNKL